MSKNEILFVSGKEWRRHEPDLTKLEQMTAPVAAVVLSYTLKDPCFEHRDCLREVKWMQKCHMFGSELGDIRYSFLIGGDAAIYEGRGWNIRPAIPLSFELIFNDCIYVGFMGQFKDEPPGEKMMESLRWLLNYGVDNNYLTSDYKEVSLERRMPGTGTGHRVASIGAYIRQGKHGHYEPHKHIYRGAARAAGPPLRRRQDWPNMR